MSAFVAFRVEGRSEVFGERSEARLQKKVLRQFLLRDMEFEACRPQGLLSGTWDLVTREDGLRFACT